VKVEHAPHTEHDWERITAADVEPGDLIANTRTEEPVRVEGIGAIGPSSRWINLEGHGRVRPRHSKKFWRVR
jgi:hypothetical protein